MGLLVIGIMLGVSGCVRGASTVEKTAAQGDSTATIATWQVWQTLESPPGLQLTGNLTCVKFVVDLEDHSRLYFVSGKRYPLHDGFVTRQFGVRSWQQMWEQYVSERRRFILGTLLYFRDANLWSFELQSEDNLSAPRLLGLYQLLRRATFFGEELSFRSTSPLHDQRAAALAGKLPLLNEAQVFAKQRFQPVQQGTAYGTLRLMKAPLDPAQVQRDDIVVTDDLPLDLPPSAALITERLQAPLSHVAVLSANRGAPDMALKGALSDPQIIALANRSVRLTVSANSYELREAEPPSTPNVSPNHEIAPPDLARTALTSLCALKRADSRFAGAKAANLGDACALLGSAVPPGFVIPFSHFVAHLKRHGLWERTQLTLEANAPALADTLAALRKAITEAPVDEALLAAIERELTTLGAQRVRIRSSTNAEDLEGFNGAGLYDSDAFSLGEGRAQLGRALGRVWASVFNLRAYQERARYGIAHERVAMAVLVQRSIDGSSANGVAISQNPFDAERPSIYINAQRRGASVTGALGDQLPEQWLVRTFLPTREPERVASSNQGAGPILMREEILALTADTENLHEHFKPTFDAHANAVDVEWVLSSERKLYIVQVRPYLVRWPTRSH